MGADQIIFHEVGLFNYEIKGFKRILVGIGDLITPINIF
jgi:hypothetical protein